MENIKIEIIGYGVEVAIGEITNTQSNHILSHQLGCTQIVPIIENDTNLVYKDWKEISSVGIFYGSVCGINSQIKVKINNVLSEFNNFSEKVESVINDESKKYLMSINHLNGVIYTHEFNVDNFDINKLKLLIKDLNGFYWGEMIYGLEYDEVPLSLTKGESTSYSFENKVILENTMVSIDKI